LSVQAQLLLITSRKWPKNDIGISFYLHIIRSKDPIQVSHGTKHRRVILVLVLPAVVAKLIEHSDIGYNFLGKVAKKKILVLVLPAVVAQLV
jgi:hypothetical protein